MKYTLPPSLTTVTPLSKSFGLALFILLPFIGFLLGVMFGMEYGVSPSPIYTAPTNPSIKDGSDTPPVLDEVNDTTPSLLDQYGNPRNNTDPKPQEPPITPPGAVVPPSSGAVSCGVTNCSGVDVTCGYVKNDEPLMCNASYALGDFCRSYVKCAVVDGSCVPVKDARYEKCATCVRDCTNISDPEKAFQCEADCREKI